MDSNGLHEKMNERIDRLMEANKMDRMNGWIDKRMDGQSPL